MDTTSLPPDDRPPVARPRRSNRGLLWASALAVVVLAIATIVAFTAGSGSSGGDVQAIDPNGTQPFDDSLVGTDVTGQHLPDVSYTTFDDQTVQLATNGRPLLINFWSSICGPCIKEMPDLQQSYQANGSQVDYLGLQVSERAQNGLDMISRTGITYPTGRDVSAEVFRAFGGVGLPRTVIVRADGTIAYVHSGPLTADQIQQAVDEALAS